MKKNNIIKKIPYKTFIPTYTAISKIPNAGYGLFTKIYLEPFTWIGFYPGDVTNNFDSCENNMHRMGTLDNKYVIEADSNIKNGVHMVNEAGCNTKANVWYVKLSNNYCLYFASTSIRPKEELLTCYSQSYGKRPYSISSNCSDPRCCNKCHRKNSIMLNCWKNILIKNKPKCLDNIKLSMSNFWLV